MSYIQNYMELLHIDYGTSEISYKIRSKYQNKSNNITYFQVIENNDKDSIIFFPTEKLKTRLEIVDERTQVVHIVGRCEDLIGKYKVDYIDDDNNRIKELDILCFDPERK